MAKKISLAQFRKARTLGRLWGKGHFDIFEKKPDDMSLGIFDASWAEGTARREVLNISDEKFEELRGNERDRWEAEYRRVCDVATFMARVATKYFKRLKAVPKFEGYFEEKDLPVRRGQEIVIPAGIMVRSTHPSRETFVTTRRQVIRVHHILPGCSWGVGFESKDGERHGSLMAGRDARLLKERFGTDDPHVLVNLSEAKVRGGNVFLPMESPKVVWAGSGGYWCEVDLNRLLLATA